MQGRDYVLAPADTDQVADGVGTHASRSMVRGGNAVHQAALLLIEQGMDCAAELLEASSGDPA